jgi:hypothetical protein
MPDVLIGTSRLIFNYKSLKTEEFTLVPRLSLDYEIQYFPGAGQPTYNLLINIVKSEFQVATKIGQFLYVGIATPAQTFLKLMPNSLTNSSFFIDLDYYRLNQIEKVREGGDLRARVEISFISEWEQWREPLSKNYNTVYLDFRIPKSDWVEKILPQLKYKEVSLIEIPKIEKPEYSDIIAKLNEAWKVYSMGEYDKVLIECRKAIEALSSIVKNKGFEREIDENGKKKVVPDWGKALGHKDTGSIIETFVQKLYGFLSPGSHYGKSINKEDAELAIMTTHALVNYVTKKVVI